MQAPNLAEGVIIKSIKNTYVHNTKGKLIRAIVKKKIEQFEEQTKAQDDNHKKAATAQQSKSLILSFITENRLNNVISKIGRSNGSKAQRANLQQLLVQDALDSFYEKNPDPGFNVATLSEEMNSKARTLIDKYFDHT